MTETVRTHVVLPKELVEGIDELVGQRHRSQFIADAAKEMLRRRRLIVAADDVRGSLANVDIPGWETPESTSEWVRAQRRGLGPLPALWPKERKQS